VFLSARIVFLPARTVFVPARTGEPVACKRARPFSGVEENAYAKERSRVF
jgi:hypothetical protein